MSAPLPPAEFGTAMTDIREMLGLPPVCGPWAQRTEGES